MRIIIDEQICNNKEISIQELLLSLVIRSSYSLQEVLDSLVKKEIVVPDGIGGYLITQHWDDVVSEVLLDSEGNSNRTQESIETLAAKLMEIFPKGKKPNTNVYWRGNLKDIKLRLKKFYKLYGNKYTDEEILKAARDYVSSFNGNYSYMRILKYFIWKDPIRSDSEGNRFVEEVSDLATFLENNNLEHNTEDQDWTSHIV